MKLLSVKKLLSLLFMVLTFASTSQAQVFATPAGLLLAPIVIYGLKTRDRTDACTNLSTYIHIKNVFEKLDQSNLKVKKKSLFYYTENLTKKRTRDQLKEIAQALGMNTSEYKYLTAGTISGFIRESKDEVIYAEKLQIIAGEVLSQMNFEINDARNENEHALALAERVESVRTQGLTAGDVYTQEINLEFCRFKPKNRIKVKKGEYISGI